MISPKVIVLMGLPLSGKSAVGRILEQQYGYKLLDVDIARKEIDKDHNPSQPRNEEHEKESMLKAYTYNHEKAIKLLKQGDNVVLSATYSKPIYHELIQAIEKTLDTNLHLFLLTASQQSIKTRLKSRSNEATALSNIRTLSDYQSVEARYIAIPSHAYTVIDTSKSTPTQIANYIARKV